MMAAKDAALLDDGTLQVHVHDTFEFARATNQK
jgi:hypothetical protein